MLITGAAGFIGTNLLQAYASRGGRPHGTYRVYGSPSSWRRAHLDELTSDVTRWHRLDLTDGAATQRLFRQVEPQIVIHTATHGGYGWQTNHERILRDNIISTLNVLEAAHACGTRLLVNLGSSSEYGAVEGPMREDHRSEPNRIYGVSKLAQTHLCRLFDSADLKVVTLRVFSAYGPWEQPGRLLPNLLLAAKTGERFFGSSPSVSRDFVAVRDIGAAVFDFDALSRTTASTINLGTGVSTRLDALVRTVERVLDTEIDVSWSDARRNPWDQSDWRADTELRAQQFPRLEPTSLDAGIRHFSNWLDEHLDVYDRVHSHPGHGA